MINTILAKERSSTPTNIPGHPEWVVVHFDVPIIPRVPIHVGQEVQVQALKTCLSRPLPGDNLHAPPTYTAHPSGITGTVIAMTAIDDANTEVVVRNESPWSEVTHAYLAIQHITGVTVQPSLWHRLLRMTVLQPIAKIREIPLERNAVVYKRENHLVRTSDDNLGRRAQRNRSVESTHEPATQLGRRGGWYAEEN